MRKQAYLSGDVSKGYSDFVLMDAHKQILEGDFVLDDTKTGRRQLTNLIEHWFDQGLQELYCGLESTGGYENNWYHLLCSLAGRWNVKVARLNPKAVKACRDASLVRTDTDALSAYGIASYMIGWPEKIRYSPHQAEPGSNWLKTRQQVRFTAMLTKQQTQLKNQLEKLLYQHLGELLVYCRHGIPGWLLRLLATYPSRQDLLEAGSKQVAAVKGISGDKAKSLLGKLDKEQADTSAITRHTIAGTARQINHLQAQINNEKTFLTDQLRDHPDVKLLTTIKGVGVASAVALVAEIEEITRFDSIKGLCGYFGVHPTWKQSGDGHWKMGMSKQGRPGVRGTLFMCGLSMIRWDERMKALYHRFRGKGMTHYQAMGVVMHKLLRIVGGILKSKTPYDPGIDQANQMRAEKRRKAKTAASEMKKEASTSRDRYKTSQQPLPPENDGAPISRRQHQKRKQAASQSSVSEEYAGSPPVD
jgi:transposase